MKGIKVTEEQFEKIVDAGGVLRDLSDRYFGYIHLSNVFDNKILTRVREDFLDMLEEKREAQKKKIDPYLDTMAQLMLWRDPQEILDRVFYYLKSQNAPLGAWIITTYAMMEIDKDEKSKPRGRTTENGANTSSSIGGRV